MFLLKKYFKAFQIRTKMTISCAIKSPYAFGVTYKLYKKNHPHKELQRFQNIHLGERCFIIGTGPSLTLEDINCLEGEYTFGVNTLFQIYKDTHWRADYYCIIDPNTYSNLETGLKSEDVKNIFIAENRMKANVMHNDNLIPFLLECSSFYRMLYPDYFGATSFSENISEEVYDGASVVYAALQIAVYMGFKTIYLIGVDCNYDQSLLHNKNLNYSKNYSYKWTKQTGLTMIKGFEVAKAYADTHGIEIYNATRGGMLEVFPRVRLQEIIKGKVN